MIRNVIILGLLVFAVTLGACNKVKEKEVAALPQSSTADTLIFEPDSVEIDTSLTELDAETYARVYGANRETETEGASENNLTASNGAESSSSGNETEAKTPEAPVSTTPAPTPAKSKPSAKPRYVKPTKKQLQRALAQDARLANQMSLPRLRDYWLKRQNYYRHAAKDIKYVAGDVKIKINTEETKIETPKGKVKIEGNDIKVKYD